MAIYSREEVIRDLTDAICVLSALQCQRAESHAINILFSHIEHLTEDAEIIRALSLSFYIETTAPAIARSRA